MLLTYLPTRQLQIRRRLRVYRTEVTKTGEYFTPSKDDAVTLTTKDVKIPGIRLVFDKDEYDNTEENGLKHEEVIQSNDPNPGVDLRVR